jgi:hypothetical protein
MYVDGSRGCITCNNSDCLSQLYRMQVYPSMTLHLRHAATFPVSLYSFPYPYWRSGGCVEVAGWMARIQATFVLAMELRHPCNNEN